MAVAASRVRAVCTGAEVRLVRTSRHPALGALTLGEVRKYAVQARKLADKWTDRSRNEARGKSPQTGARAAADNTQLKAQIFRDALASFEARAAELSAAGAHPGDAPKPPKHKRKRSAAHRASRTTARQGLAVEASLLNAQAGARPRKRSAKPSPSASVPAEPPAKTPVAAPPARAAKAAAKKPKPPAKAGAKPAKPAAKTTSLKAVKRQPAVAAAKKSRLDRSGITTRKAGHIGARTRRKQGRRDARG
jgi:hypothetical protein